MKPVEQAERKNPTAPDTGAVAAAGLGVTPADAAKATQLYKYEMPYRFCAKAAGLTYPIAICVTCGKVIWPSREEYSRTGSHGTWYYVHEHPLAFIVLTQSNTGRRSASRTDNVPKALYDIVYETWVYYEDSTVEEVEGIISTWLHTQKLYEKARGESA
jgi:Holliday junction resolvase RusA-like endonuclease